jgi:hypothetical protein
MPASTPIYGFTYPCPDEVISPASFSMLANQIDAKLLEVEADRFLALNRYNSDVSSSFVDVLTAGVELTLASPGSRYTLPVDGVYIFDVDVVPITTPATITVFRTSVYQGANYRFGFTQNTEGNAAIKCSPRGPIVGVAGDVITTRAIYLGTGTMNVQSRMSVKMIVRVA